MKTQFPRSKEQVESYLKKQNLGFNLARRAKEHSFYLSHTFLERAVLRTN